MCLFLYKEGLLETLSKVKEEYYLALGSLLFMFLL